MISGSQPTERKARTGKRDRTRAVISGNRDRAIVPRDEREGFFFRQSDREHCAFAASTFLHQTRSQRDHAGRVFNGKDAGDASRGDLAHAVADDSGRLHAPGFPERGERHLHGKNGRLPDLRPRDAGGFFAAAEFFEKGEAGPGTQSGVATFHRFAEDRLVLHQFAPHPPPLRTLAAHDEPDLRRCFAPGGES